MPPPLVTDDVDDEFEEAASEASDGLDTIPAKAPKGGKKQAKIEEVVAGEESEASAEDQEDEEDDDDDDEETYAVERIEKHDWSPEGIVLYKVKWLGYEKEADKTWEPEANLIDGAADILQTYKDKCPGGPPQDQPPKSTAGSAKKGRGKRKAETEVEDSPAPKPGRKRSKTSANGEQSGIPDGDWEEQIETINTITEGPGGAKNPSLRVFVAFKNGHKATLSMSTVRERCPQKLLDYYEQHLIFTEAESDHKEHGVEIRAHDEAKQPAKKGRKSLNAK